MRFLNEDIDSRLDDLVSDETAEILDQANQGTAKLADDIEQAADDIDEVEIPAMHKDDPDMELLLDACLSAALYAKRAGTDTWTNALLVGRAGIGKTGRVNAWAKSRHVNILYKDAKLLDELDLGGGVTKNKDNTAFIRLANDEFKKLDKPNTVLFLDEFNRARQTVRGSLLSLINEHYLADPREPEERHIFKGFLFTVAAINPETPDYGIDEPLNKAEKGRFKQLWVEPSIKATKDHLKQKYENLLKTARDKKEAQMWYNCLRLSQFILSSARFSFDTADEEAATADNYQVLNPRSLEAEINSSQGEKDWFLFWWEKDHMNKFAEIKSILSTYRDKELPKEEAARFDNTDVTTDTRKQNADKANQVMDIYKDDKRYGNNNSAQQADQDQLTAGQKAEQRRQQRLAAQKQMATVAGNDVKSGLNDDDNDDWSKIMGKL